VHPVLSMACANLPTCVMDIATAGMPEKSLIRFQGRTLGKKGGRTGTAWARAEILSSSPLTSVMRDKKSGSEG
jgi:hypothetical protein